MLLDALLALLLTLPPSKYTDEAPAARGARMGAVASAVASASEELTCYRAERCKRVWPGPARELALVLVTIAWHESGLDAGVHAGRCLPFQCDPVRGRGGEVLRHRAASLWQIHSNAFVPRRVWETLAGTDEESTRRAAIVAGRIASVARRMCEYQHRNNKDWLTMTFAAYGTGGSCFKKSAEQRTTTFRRLDKKLEQIKMQLRAQS